MFNNTVKYFYIEKVDFDQYLDASRIHSSSTTGVVTGLTHLAGTQVYARVDDYVEGPFFVSDAGVITVGEESDNVRIGLNYIPEIISMPIVSRQFFGSNVYNPKHISSMYIDYYLSLSILVNGFEIPQISLNNFVLDQRPIPQTDFFEVSPPPIVTGKQ